MMRLFIWCLIALAAATKVDGSKYLDNDSDVSVEKLAEVVCKTTKGLDNLIGRVSTLYKLVDFLGEISSEHHLYDCTRQSLSSMEQLIQVIEVDSNNVCSDEKLTLIENYHREFVSKAGSHEEQRKQRGTRAPKLVQLYFMQYATQVSTLCEQPAIDSLEQTKKSLKPEDVEKIEQMRKFTDALGMSDLTQGYNGIYLFWNMVNSLGLAENEKFSSFLAKEGETRLSVQMKDGRAMNGLQAICRLRLKPIYSTALLPVLRLVDMGYYPDGNKLVELLNQESGLRSLFFATQICETLLPVAVYSDDQLAEDQFVALTREEAANLPQPKLDGLDELSEIPVELGKPKTIDVDKLISCATDLNTIKSNVASRSKVVNRMLKQLWFHIKDKLKSMFSGFKLFRKDLNQKLEPIDDEATLKRLDSEGPILINEESEDDLVLKRRKRWLITRRVILNFFCDIFYWIYMTFLILIKLAVFGIPAMVIMVLGMSHDADAAMEKLDWMYTIGNYRRPNWGMDGIQ